MTNRPVYRYTPDDVHEIFREEDSADDVPPLIATVVEIGPPTEIILTGTPGEDDEP